VSVKSFFFETFLRDFFSVLTEASAIAPSEPDFRFFSDLIAGCFLFGISSSFGPMRPSSIASARPSSKGLASK
jgi:hypothetical protein